MSKKQKAAWEAKLEEMLKEQEENWRAGRKEDWRLSQRIRMAQQKRQRVLG